MTEPIDHHRRLYGEPSLLEKLRVMIDSAVESVTLIERQIASLETDTMGLLMPDRDTKIQHLLYNSKTIQCTVDSLSAGIHLLHEEYIGPMSTSDETTKTEK